MKIATAQICHHDEDRDAHYTNKSSGFIIGRISLLCSNRFMLCSLDSMDCRNSIFAFVFQHYLKGSQYRRF